MICPEGEGEIQGSSVSPESYDWPDELIEYCKHGCLEVCFSVFSFKRMPISTFLTADYSKRENVKGPAQRLRLDCLLWATVGTWQPL